MTPVRSQDLAQTTILALERMAFVLSEQIDPREAAALTAPAFHARITFVGAGVSGTIYLAASEGFIAEMSSSMLGLEPGEIHEDIATLGPQAVCELANVVAGELITLLGSRDTEFQLGLPECCDAGDIEKEAAAASCFLDTGGEVLEVHVHG